MFSATAIVRSGGLFSLNQVAMVVFMLCSAVLLEWLLLKPCYVEVCEILMVMYGNSVFSSIFAIAETGEMGLHNVPMFMSFLDFRVDMMFASFHI